MDSIIKTLEREGYGIIVEEGRTYVSISNTKIQFVLTELHKSHFAEPPVKSYEWQLKYDKDYNPKNNPNNYIRKYTGKFCLSILSGDYTWNYKQRKNWRETSQTSTEQVISKFITGLLKASVLKTEYLEKKQKEKLIKEEKERISALNEKLEQWFECKRIRKFISQVQLQKNKKNEAVGDDYSVEWIKWAHKYADSLDPFIKSPPSLFDEMNN